MLKTYDAAMSHVVSFFIDQKMFHHWGSGILWVYNTSLLKDIEGVYLRVKI